MAQSSVAVNHFSAIAIQVRSLHFRKKLITQTTRDQTMIHRFALLLISSLLIAAGPASAQSRWTAERANAWYESQPWLVGSIFVPNTAINQLEMWQADTFDIETIDRELGGAEQLGFNTMRMFLHDSVSKT